MTLGKSLKSTIFAVVNIGAFSTAHAADITGAGLNYQSIGSGGGIKQIKAKTQIKDGSGKAIWGKSNKDIGWAIILQNSTISIWRPFAPRR